LPSTYAHTTIPVTRHLLKSQQIKDWINNYQPGHGEVEEPQLDVRFDSDSSHVLWAADVWYSVKKHWVLELQRLLRSNSQVQDQVLGRSADFPVRSHSRVQGALETSGVAADGQVRAPDQIENCRLAHASSFDD
jgi:hypothetical protein